MLVLDSSSMSRLGVVGLLNAQEDMQVCADTGDPTLARTFCITHQPDVVLFDSELPQGSPVTFLRELSTLAPATRAIMVAANENSEYLHRAMRTGALAVISKYDEANEYLTGIRAVLCGEHFVSRRMAGTVMRMVAEGRFNHGDDGVSKLSNRELEVFRLIGMRKGAKAIATELGLSVRTIETHQARIKEKLRLKTSEELHSFAINWRMKKN